MSALKDLRALKFKGGRKEFWLRKNKFLSYAASRGYDDLLIEDPKKIFKHHDADGNESKPISNFDADEKAEYERHMKAMIELKLCMDHTSGL